MGDDIDVEEELFPLLIIALHKTTLPVAIFFPLGSDVGYFISFISLISRITKFLCVIMKSKEITILFLITKSIFCLLQQGEGRTHSLVWSSDIVMPSYTMTFRVISPWTPHVLPEPCGAASSRQCVRKSESSHHQWDRIPPKLSCVISTFKPELLWTRAPMENWSSQPGCQSRPARKKCSFMHAFLPQSLEHFNISS